jgi:hypothetical protein
MPNRFPDLSAYLADLGEPSNTVLAEAWSALEQAIATGETGEPASTETAMEPRGRDVGTFGSPKRSSSRRRKVAVLAAVVAASIAAVVVPLAVRSGHRTPLTVTSTTVTTTRPHIAPLAYTAATPKGWSPVAFESVQISVPSSWFIEDPGYSCGGGVNGMVFIAQAPHVPAGAGCRLPSNVVTLTSAGRSPVPHARTAIVNGVHVQVGWTRAGSAVAYTERGLGMEVTASGPLARRVLQTITHSPLSVVLGSAVSGSPPGWRTVAFGGLRFAVPSSWQIGRDSWWGGCPYDIATNDLRLSTAQSLSVPGCPPPPTNAGYEAALPGMVIGAGPQVTAYSAVPGKRCVQRNSLRICIDPPPLGGGFTPGRQLGLLTAEVFLPGQTRPDQVEIGLSGSGLTPLRIFDSLRASAG